MRDKGVCMTVVLIIWMFNTVPVSLQDDDVIKSRFFSLRYNFPQVCVCFLQRLDLPFCNQHLIEQIACPSGRRALLSKTEFPPFLSLQSKNVLQCSQLLFTFANCPFAAHDNLLVKCDVLDCLEYWICVCASTSDSSHENLKTRTIHESFKHPSECGFTRPYCGCTTYGGIIEYIKSAMRQAGYGIDFTVVSCNRNKFCMFHTPKWLLIAFERETKKYIMVWSLLQPITLA